MFTIHGGGSIAGFGGDAVCRFGAAGPADSTCSGVSAFGQITCTESGENYTCSGRLSGVQPEGVFTTWLVNMQPKMEMEPAGEKFTADASGAAQVKFNVPKTAFEKWQMLVIALHPDGDAANMEDHVDVLKADLKSNANSRSAAKPASSPVSRPAATPVGSPVSSPVGTPR